MTSARVFFAVGVLGIAATLAATFLTRTEAAAVDASLFTLPFAVGGLMAGAIESWREDPEADFALGKVAAVGCGSLVLGVVLTLAFFLFVWPSL